MFFLICVSLSASSNDQKQIVQRKHIQEYQCPAIPTGYFDFSNGTSRPGYSVSGYACNAVFSSIVSMSSLLVLYNCKFNSITVPYGGPVTLNYYTAGDNEIIIEKCEFTSCVGLYAGCMMFRVPNKCHVKINECNFEGNKASMESGGVDFYGELLTIKNSKFKNNLGKLNGDEVLIHYTGPSNDATDNIVIESNVFIRTEKEDSESSLIFFENTNNKFKFTFNKNKINIDTEGATVYLFNCNGDDKFTVSVSDNFITTSNKENIVGDKFQNNADANIDFDFDKDFQATPSIPEDQITPDSSCSVITFDDLTPTVINQRCDHDGKNDKTALITVIRSDFTDFKQQQSGGALHITNCGVNCKKAQFKKCVSNSGGGGAVYIKNTASLSNNVDLENLKFVECQALFGGAIYAYSASERNAVNIIQCTFTENSLLSGSSSSSESENGGSAIFLTVKNGKINGCTFTSSKKGNLIKVTNDYDGGLNAVQLDKQNSLQLLLISDCSFHQMKDSESSIFYESSIEIGKLEITRCNFRGELNNGSHYIECRALNEKSFIVKSCSFENNNKNAVSFMISSDSNNKWPNYLTFLTNNLMVAASVLAVFAILVVVIVVRIGKSHKSDSENNDEDTQDSLEISEKN